VTWKLVAQRAPAGQLMGGPVPGGVGAQVSAGVVMGDQLYAQPAAKSKLGMSLQSPATWATIWVVLALLYLVGIYVGSIRISGGAE